MKLSKQFILGIRLRPHAGSLADTNISDKGLICGYDKDKACIGETAIETMRDSTKVKASELKPLILKAYYSTATYPKIPKLKINAKEYKQAHEDFRKSFIEIDIEQQTAFWLVRRVGFDNLRPPVVQSGTLNEIDLLANPMVDITKMLPMLEIKVAPLGLPLTLQIAEKERKFLFELSKALDELRGSLHISEIDLDELVSKTPAEKRKPLLKKIKELNKLL